MKIKLLVSMAGDNYDYQPGAIADVKDGFLTVNCCRGLMLNGAAEPADKASKELLEQALQEQQPEVQQTSGLVEMAAETVARDAERVKARLEAEERAKNPLAEEAPAEEAPAEEAPAEEAPAEEAPAEEAPAEDQPKTL